MLEILIVESDPAALGRGFRQSALYADALKACRDDLTLTVVSPYDGEDMPDPAAFDGVVFTGSGVDWSTEDSRAAPLAQAMRQVFAAKSPTFGSCNGMQLAACVLGGRSLVSPKGREDGLAREIQLTDAGRAHPMMAGRQDGYAVPCIHRDEVVALPEGAILLAGNAHSAVQAFAYERDGVSFWGVQYHPEYTADFIAGRVAAMGAWPDKEAAALSRAEIDRDAAEVLGVRWEDLQPQMRLTELRNWLARL